MIRRSGGSAGLHYRTDPVAVRVPASSANLGPGFDSFALALSLYDEVEARVTAGGLDIEVVGRGASEVPRDESNLVARALRATFDALGTAQPGLRLACRNEVPQGRGLGSSAAAIVAGIRLGEALAEAPLAPGRDLGLATALEGHPDNAAACLLGGLAVAWMDPPFSGAAAAEEPATAAGCGVHAVRLDVHGDVRPVVFLPPNEMLTCAARQLLPRHVSHSDAQLTASRAGLLVAALTSYPECLLAATEDRLHQQFRRPAMPATLQLIDSMRAAGIAAAVSGAGPSVLALSTPYGPVDPSRWTPAGWRCLTPPVDLAGASGIAPTSSALTQLQDTTSE